MKVKMTTALTTKELNLSFGDVVLVDSVFGKNLIETNMAVLIEEKVKTPKKQEPIEETPTETPIKRGRKKKVVK